MRALRLAMAASAAQATPRLPYKCLRIRFRARRANQPHRFPPSHPAPRRGRQDAISAHPHMLRHACGFKLANDGHDTRALQHYLGHKNIQHTVRYTEMASDRFKDFWRD